MAIAARYGKPTYFLTITCNIQWHEIQEDLYDGQMASSLTNKWKVRIVEEVDNAITAEIPNGETEPEAHAAVISYMIQRKCGIEAPVMGGAT
ncbi:hypothetical protein ANCDUO_12531 [Ancylostoma duodenale]|uniref:Helitron helicase-like domain-containing protein n=1 Tax=Ancylostoma duodenale TaxID=51022 RepID=A0A0C2GEB8_9BILA|nr:hypothetical protein ANCDUO_12531 [Ancylostoma duodenale]